MRKIKKDKIFKKEKAPKFMLAKRCRMVKKETIDIVDVRILNRADISKKITWNESYNLENFITGKKLG